ncbi:MAG: hypothetical protein ABGX12_02040 [Desulfurobacteriaceae bacterium]
MDFRRFIERHLFPLILFAPVFFKVPEVNLRLEVLSTRCLFLDLLVAGAFFLYKNGIYSYLLPFPVSGFLFSAIYLWKGWGFLLPLCLAGTVSSVMLSSFVLFVSIKVNFGG